MTERPNLAGKFALPASSLHGSQGVADIRAAGVRRGFVIWR